MDPNYNPTTNTPGLNAIPVSTTTTTFTALPQDQSILGGNTPLSDTGAKLNIIYGEGMGTLGSAVAAPPPPPVSATPVLMNKPGFEEVGTPMMDTTPVAAQPMMSTTPTIFPSTMGLETGQTTQPLPTEQNLNLIPGLSAYATPLAMGHPLHILSNLDGVRIERLPEAVEPTGAQLRYRFNISSLTWPNSNLDPIVQHPILYAVENQEFFTQEVRSTTSALELHIYNQTDNSIVLIVARPRGGLTKQVKVYDANREYLGKVKKAILSSRLVIQDPSKRSLYDLKPVGTSKAWSTMTVLREKDPVSVIHKLVPGVGRQEVLHTDANIFDVLFPVGEDARVRALFMAATLFADLLWFEKEV
jgi:hypothetical protein